MARVCKECGEMINAAKQPRLFCSPVCRLSFNNRRLQRGALLYDLFMTMRYERGIAVILGVWAIMCRIAKDFRDEDDRERGGRKSWQPANDAIERLPVLVKAKDVTIVRDFTGRGKLRNANGG